MLSKKEIIEKILNYIEENSNYCLKVTNKTFGNGYYLFEFGEDSVCHFTGMQNGTYFVIDGGCIDVENVKPYLFPLSNMTEEQENEWDNLHLNPLGAILEGKFNRKEEHMQLLSKSMSDPVQWCYKNHFDCRGLIPMGLAIDATGKNIY